MVVPRDRAALLVQVEYKPFGGCGGSLIKHSSSCDIVRCWFDGVDKIFDYVDEVVT